MSKNYLLLKKEELKKCIEDTAYLETHYQDPDRYNEILYQDLQEKWSHLCVEQQKCNLLDSKANRYSSDFIGLSIQRLQQAYQKGYITVDEIIEYLENTGGLGGRMIWPVHGNPTINTYRSQCYHDRFDLFLEDLKNFYLESENWISPVFGKFLKNSLQEKEFLFSYGKGRKGFQNLIQEWKLEPFMVGYYMKNCEEYYQVLCLAHSDFETEKILPIQKVDGQERYAENINDTIKPSAKRSDSMTKQYFCNFWHNTEIAIQEREKLLKP